MNKILLNDNINTEHQAENQRQVIGAQVTAKAYTYCRGCQGSDWPDQTRWIISETVIFDLVLNGHLTLELP